VRDSLIGDLQRRALPSGAALPHAKELAARYGCCFRTLSRALESVTASGLLARENRRLVSPALRASALRNTIVVIVRGTGSGSTVPIGTWAPRNRQQFEALEQQAAEVGCRLAFAVYTYVGPRLLGPAGRPLMAEQVGSRRDVLGFMFWAQGLGGLDPAVYLRDLERFGKPIAVLDVGGMPELERPGGARLRRVFRLGTDERCGEIVGNYLLGLGHRGVDYLSGPAPLPRLVGLRRVYGQAGLGDAVTRLDASQGREAVAREEVDARYGALLGAIERNAAARGLRQFLNKDRERLVDKALERTQLDAMRPALAAALRSVTGTALVCESDGLALYCLELLRNLGVRVPEERSVVGFDDEEDAFLWGLSSYNFNLKAVVAAMMDYVLRPHSAARVGDGAAVVIDGYVKARTTTSSPGEGRQWILA
jgi:hypothetical protein